MGLGVGVAMTAFSSFLGCTTRLRLWTRWHPPEIIEEVQQQLATEKALLIRQELSRTHVPEKARGAKASDDEPKAVQGTVAVRAAFMVFFVEAVVFVALATIVWVPYKIWLHARAWEEERALQRAVAEAQDMQEQLLNLTTEESAQWFLEEMPVLEQTNFKLRTQLRAILNRTNSEPYRVISMMQHPHELPFKYGEVKEKTIWAYWYHPEKCPSSLNCRLPSYINLCLDTVKKNRGGFDFIMVHKDEVDEYVSRTELPVHFAALLPDLQRDAIINALLARYGGVAWDPSTVLLRPLDDYWDEMVARGATFRGYVFRLNGLPWRHPETTASWFLMSRREGIFAAAVRDQVVGMGDRSDPLVYLNWHTAFSDQTLTPLLSMFNYSLPRCTDDVTVWHGLEDRNFSEMCPENAGPQWWKALTGPPKNDTRILLRDPRDGPLLPFAFLDMELWNLSGSPPPQPETNHSRMMWSDMLGAAMYDTSCPSMLECWNTYFEQRYRARPAPGEAPALSFVRLEGLAFRKLSHSELLSRNESFFYQWLKLAGLDI